MNRCGRQLLGGMIGLALLMGLVDIAAGQPLIRIGPSLSLTGTYAALGQSQRRGHQADGFQLTHKMAMFQWQDGQKVIVWPEEMARGQMRFPTSPWSRR